MSGPKDKTEEIINLIWNKELYYLVAAGNDAPSAKSVKELASRYGVSLPKDYIAHVTGRWGSPYIEVKEEFWRRHKVYDVGPFWSFLYGLFGFAYSNDVPEWMQIEVAAKEFQKMGHQVLPILKVVGDADIYCFNSKGGIQKYSHEEDSFEDYDGNFFDLLRFEFLELDDRRKEKMGEKSTIENGYIDVYLTNDKKIALKDVFRLNKVLSLDLPATEMKALLAQPNGLLASNIPLGQTTVRLTKEGLMDLVYFTNVNSPDQKITS